MYFKYILFNCKAIFVKNLWRNDKNFIIVVNHYIFYFLSLHLKLSSFFYSTQLIDLFSYEFIVNKYRVASLPSLPTNSNNFLVYNFHSILNQSRFFLFVKPSNLTNINANNTDSNSITELFLNANWLEREASELNGLHFSGKKDLRNLMLQYGDVSAPFQKSYPSIGTREIFYDVVNDMLIQTRVSIQF